MTDDYRPLLAQRNEAASAGDLAGDGLGFSASSSSAPVLRWSARPRPR